MTEQTDHPPVDRTSWPAGPWDDEPDRLEWEHAGRPCLAVRHPRFGNWCGYAAVDPGHPLHGQKPWEIDVDVHGSLTYADSCGGHICHVPKPGQPDDVWWFGFDCGHSMDLAPGTAATLRAHGLELEGDDDIWRPHYRPLGYVKAETERLAEQLVALG